jgi:hypothetical protein
MLVEINAEPGTRESLEAAHGQVWSPDELKDEFDVIGWGSPFVVARRRSDNALGSLKFQHTPRFYFCWTPD